MGYNRISCCDLKFMEINFTEISNVKYVDSRELAKCLSKHHRHVLDKIRKFKARIEGETEQEIRIEYSGSQVKNVLLNLRQALELLECYKACNSLTELKIFLAGQSRSDLDEIWTQVLLFVRPIGTQVLLRQHGTLIEYSPDRACIKISSQPLLNIVKDKVGAIEPAFAAAGYPTILSLEVARAQKTENSWSVAVVASDRPLDKSQTPINEPKKAIVVEPNIDLRSIDGYINATKLTNTYQESTGKRKDVADWLRQKRTQEMMAHLTSNTGIPVFELYQVFQGSPESGGGTWLHPRLSVRFGMWLSDDFGLLVENKVEEWLKGSAQPAPQAIEPPLTQLQALAKFVQAAAEFEQRQLAVNAELKGGLQGVEQRVAEVEGSLERIKFDRDLAQDNLLQLPLASEAPPSVSKRNACNLLVRNYCHQSGRTYSEVWREIYTDMKYRYGYDAIARTDNYNRDIPKNQRGYIDQCEIDGKLEELHKVISFKLYPNSAQN